MSKQLLIMDKPIRFNKPIEIIHKAEFIKHIFTDTDIIESKSTELIKSEIEKNNKIMIVKINKNNKDLSDGVQKFITNFSDKIDMSQFKDVNLRLNDAKDEINKLISKNDKISKQVDELIKEIIIQRTLISKQEKLEKSNEINEKDLKLQIETILDERREERRKSKKIV